MDGVAKSEYKRVFVLTTNTMEINQNMIDRPGRLRYIVPFGNLAIDVIDEIVEDLLIHKHLKAETVKYIASLELITIDVVKSVIEEVNIHNESPENFKDIFNIREVKKELTVYKVVVDAKGIESEEFEGVIPVPNWMNDDGTVEYEDAVYNNLYVKNKNLGEIKEAEESYIVCSKNGKFNVKDGTYEKIETKYFLKLTKSVNSHFRNYDFAM